MQLAAKCFLIFLPVDSHNKLSSRENGHRLEFSCLAHWCLIAVVHMVPTCEFKPCPFQISNQRLCQIADLFNACNLYQSISKHVQWISRPTVSIEMEDPPLIHIYVAWKFNQRTNTYVWMAITGPLNVGNVHCQIATWTRLGPPVIVYSCCPISSEVY